MVGGLVVRGDGGAALAPSGPMSRLVEDLIGNALALLQSKRGSEKLSDIGKEVVKERRNDQRPCSYPEKESRNAMPAYVAAFLELVELDFPEVILSNIGGEAETHRKDLTLDITEYTPKQGGSLLINQTILTYMLEAEDVKESSRQDAKLAEAEADDLDREYRRARDKRKGKDKDTRADDIKAAMKSLDRTARDARATEAGARETVAGFRVLMSIALAHELVHFFVGYLSGGEAVSQLTPGPVVDGSGKWGNPDNNEGESGRRWEEKVFGGNMTFFKDPANHPLGDKQAGVAYVMDRHRLCTELSREDIRKFAFAKPVKLTSSSKPVTQLADLERRCTRMSRVRRARALQQTVAASPGPASGPAQQRCDPPSGGSSGYYQSGSTVSDMSRADGYFGNWEAAGYTAPADQRSDNWGVNDLRFQSLSFDEY